MEIIVMNLDNLEDELSSMAQRAAARKQAAERSTQAAADAEAAAAQN